MDFGHNLSTLLELHQKTQHELAIYLGVTPSAVCHWVAGSVIPALPRLPKIAAFFGSTSVYIDLLAERGNRPLTHRKHAS